MNKLFLFDGHSLIFRMYYAFLRKPMINSKGVDTSILYGFTKYLLETVAREAPTHIAVAFDPPAKTFRHEAYPEYKANRMETPDLVRSALEPLCQIVSALGIPVLMRPGFEADDVICSVAKKYAAQGFDVYMVTPDKDFGQVVGDHIYQYKPGKGGDNVILGAKEICEIYGVPTPQQVIDYLTICGDTADNVPGVSGVGDVGAKKLLGKYGTLDGIYEHIEELTKRQQELFNAAKPHIEMSRFLVTINSAVEVDVTADELRNSMCLNAEVQAIFREYEFNSLRRLLPECEDIVVDDGAALKTVEVHRASLSNLLSAAKDAGLIAMKVNGKQVMLCSRAGFVNASLADEAVQHIIADPSVAKAGYALKPQLKQMLALGLLVKGDLYDIELMHYLINPERAHSVEILTDAYLGKSLFKASEEITAVQGDLFTMAVAEPIGSDESKSAAEIAAILELCPLLIDELENCGEKELYLDIEMPLISVLADMEMTGVKVDLKILKEYGEELKKHLVQIEDTIRKMVDEPALNLSSPRQVGNVLFEKLKLNPKIKKTKRDNYPTDEDTLNELRDKHPVIDLILEFRGVKKLLGTYIDPFPELVNPATGRVHTTFNQALTATGRLSSIKPNLQNIPIRTEQGQRIREAFVPSNGVLVAADYSQIELRLMACLSKDESMLADFRNGDDIHKYTASKVFKVPLDQVTKEQRRIAKTANFGIIYGISPFGLSQRLGIPRSEAKRLIDEYFCHYPAISNYIEDVIEKGRVDGYVQTLFHRRRYLPDLNSHNQTVRKLAERNAVNAPIQGSAADIIKLAMINVHKRLNAEGLRSRLVLQVHDELVLDVFPDELDLVMSLVKEEMESVVALDIPLIVECSSGENWLQAH